MIMLLLRWLAGAVFVLSGILKIVEPGRFLLDLQAFGFISYPLAYATALFLPWMELFCGVALWANRLTRGASVLLAGLTLAFITLLLFSEWRGVDVECGCFGEWFVFPSLGAHVAFNLGLLVALIVIAVRSRATK